MTIRKPNFLAPKGTMVYRADKDPDVDMSLPPFDLGVAQGAAYSKMLLEVFANDVPNEIKVRAKSVVCGGYLSGICDDATLAAAACIPLAPAPLSCPRMMTFSGGCGVSGFNIIVV